MKTSPFRRSVVRQPVRVRRALAAVVTLLLAAATPACGGDDDDPSTNTTVKLGPTQTLTADQLTATIDETGDRIQLARSGQPPMQISASELALGRGTWNVEHSFGSFKFLVGAESAWQAGAQLHITAVSPTPATGKASIPRPNPQLVEFEVRDAADVVLFIGKLSVDGQGFRLRLVAADRTFTQSRLAYALAADEHVLGLGGQSFDVDHCGQRARLWVTEDGIGKNPVDENDYSLWPLSGQRYTTHTPMPMYVSSAGHTLMLHTDHAITVDLGKTTPNLAVWQNEHPDLDLWWSAGFSPGDNVSRLTGHMGRPVVPPLFAFGVWVDAIFGRDNVLRVANKLRSLQIPSSVLWSEDWRGGHAAATDYTLEEDWKADETLYPNFASFTSSLHDLGYKILTYNNTFLEQGSDVYPEAISGEHYIKTATGEMFTFLGASFKQTSLADLTRPETFDWVKAVYKEGLDLGADGWMADFCEWLPTNAYVHGGLGWDWHQRYPVLCQQVNKELFDAVGKDGVERLFFVRSAWLGSQPLVSVVWAGDQQTDFSAGDGLPSVIPMGIGLGITGFPFYAHDIGGYASAGTDTTTKELWWRWATLSALTPVMRTHHGKLALGNWNWESDAATEQVFARWTRLHMQLVPYLYRLAELVPETGLPLFAPLALQFPTFGPGWTRTDQYLLGDRIAVAPVVAQGQTSRDVELPAGSWYPLLGGPLLQSSGAAQTVQVPLSEIPAYVPAGTLLVLWPEGVQSTEPNGQHKGRRLPNDAQAAREVWVWPGQVDDLHAGWRSWSDSGRTYDWQAGSWSGACSAASWNGSAVAIAAGRVKVTGPGTLTLDGGGTLTIGGSTAAGDVTEVVCAALRGAPVPIQP